MKMKAGLVVIPAYNPPSTLLKLAKDIITQGIEHLIIVNDGSGKKYCSLFKKIKQIPECVILNHPENQGKGQALKTAFAYVLKNYSDDLELVMADADSQHSPPDIIKVLEMVKGKQSTIVLGVRKFNHHTPAPNRLGNALSNFLFAFINRRQLTDTQTGLRSISTDILSKLIKLPGNSYNYEINMLLYARSLGIKIEEETIDTIYIEGENPSHFNPLRDTSKIFISLFNYAFVRIAQKFGNKT